MLTSNTIYPQLCRLRKRKLLSRKCQLIIRKLSLQQNKKLISKLLKYRTKTSTKIMSNYCERPKDHVHSFLMSINLLHNDP